jgi:oligoendopeptidase F
MQSRNRAPSLILVLVIMGTVLTAQDRSRASIPDKYKWNLADLYPSEAAWQEAKDRLKPQIAAIAPFKGTLGTSPARLAEALDAINRVAKDLQKSFTYVSLLADEDTRIAKHQGMQQEMQQIAAGFSEQVSFLEPEVLKIGKAKIDGWVAQEARLKTYTHYLDDLQRRQPHTLSDAEERLLASSSLATASASSTYNILSNADFPYPSITLSDGKTVKLNSAGYSLHRSSPNRGDRQKVMQEFFTSLGKFRSTFGTTLNGQVQANLFNAKARKYEMAIDAALDSPNVPVTVYKQLVDGVNQGLPTFHRYLQLRKRMMNLPDLAYYDLYAPLVASVDLTYTPEESEKHVLASLAPLGAEYVGAVRRAFNERWFDLMPNEGKRSGAYSNGSAYDVHPYMLINFNGKYTDVSTVTHEIGHTMQSYLSNKTQPFHLANYPIFVAEVASTFNEALLIDYMLKQIKDDNVRLSLLGNYLENIKGTVFRQTQFAEFELRIHQMAERNEPLTGESLDKTYLEITRKYYGHDKGVCQVPDYIAHEWAFIPHFYLNFYVFQYATSFTASEALASKVLAGDPAATKRYLTFLSAGGSKYPIDLLKDAGVDMTTTEPLQLTLKKMNAVMDEMERILAARK